MKEEEDEQAEDRELLEEVSEVNVDEGDTVVLENNYKGDMLIDLFAFLLMIYCAHHFISFLLLS